MADTHAMYELMYIVNPVLNSEQTKDIVDRVAAYLREHGAEIVATNEIGSQRLAYPIQKKRNGYYVNVYFRGPGEIIARFDRALRINEDVLRHLILRYDAKMERHYEQQARGEAPRPALSGPVAEEA